MTDISIDAQITIESDNGFFWSDILLFHEVIQISQFILFVFCDRSLWFVLVSV